MLKILRCQAGHKLNGRGWVLYYSARRDSKTYRRCLNKSSVMVKNEDSGPDKIALCPECNRNSQA